MSYRIGAAAAGITLYILSELFHMLRWGSMLVLGGDATSLGVVIMYRKEVLAVLLALVVLTLMVRKRSVNPVLGVITFIFVPLYMMYSLAIRMMNEYAMVGAGMQFGFWDWAAYLKYSLLLLGVPCIVAALREGPVAHQATDEGCSR